MTKKTRKCPNCGKETFSESIYHPGYGAGDGAIHKWRLKCPVCQKGCYEGSYDDIPGFKESDEGECCYCGSTKKDRREKKFFFAGRISIPVGDKTIVALYPEEDSQFFDEEE